jgi:signal transduction histidine kinase/DNA-binding response OmpR family regulator
MCPIIIEIVPKFVLNRFAKMKKLTPGKITGKPETALLHNNDSLILISILLIFLSIACNRDNKPDQFVIGFSQCVESDNWRKTMLESMKRELAFHSNVQFIYEQADGNSLKQIEQVKDLVRKKIDLLIISPNEAQPLTPVVEEAFNKGIPVITVDRKISSSLYTAYVGADNYQIGKMAGEYVSHLLKGKGRIVEITGLPASSAAIERHKGFIEGIRNYDSLRIVKQVNGQWMKETAVNELSKIADAVGDIDLAFAHNDMMALATYEVLKNKGADSRIKIIGVDGLPGPGLGIEFVSNKILTATMLYPTGGEESIRIAMQILNKENYSKENILQTSVVDSTNVHLMKLQTDKINSQQNDIERQQGMIAEQQRIYNNQRTILYILAAALVISVSLGGIVLYFLRENRKINKKLEAQNEEISSQKSQLIEMSAKAQAANEAKINFFTNISHEFRTPLTLILAPLDELISDTRTNYTTQQSLSLIRKNGIRLLRLVNQLMDFRKIEFKKMHLKASENDLLSFVNEILETYRTIAHTRNIDLRLLTKERKLDAWFDVSMLDKVLFNLLSNSFKFTNDNGFIHVYIERDEMNNCACIKVQDNGVGMTKDAVAHGFDVFYQGEYENYKGSGLGLALSNELIQLHHGSISVTSEKWKGTTFQIRLPLGYEHLETHELVEKEDLKAVIFEDEKIYTTDLQQEEFSANPMIPVKKEMECSLLIIEDDPDLRNFLSSRLSSEYEILVADNGNSALQQAFDIVPDLIICDVIIPGKDGMALTNILKSDIRTSHIPIILLTIKTRIEEQIEGMKNMADAYITKPFNLKFLEENIKSLLANRTKLKEHFTGELPLDIKSQTSNKLDRKFIHEFTALVESNIANENFSIEDICKNIGVSRVQLYRKIKALLGCNVNDYILNTRMQKAKYLLQHEELSIGEVAYKVGFSSQAYFSTVFKSKFGATPTAFKEK